MAVRWRMVVTLFVVAGSWGCPVLVCGREGATVGESGGKVVYSSVLVGVVC